MRFRWVYTDYTKWIEMWRRMVPDGANELMVQGVDTRSGETWNVLGI